MILFCWLSRKQSENLSSGYLSWSSILGLGPDQAGCDNAKHTTAWRGQWVARRHRLVPGISQPLGAS